MSGSMEQTAKNKVPAPDEVVGFYDPIRDKVREWLGIDTFGNDRPSPQPSPQTHPDPPVIREGEGGEQEEGVFISF